MTLPKRHVNNIKGVPLRFFAVVKCTKHSPVVSSALTILQPQVRIPSKLSGHSSIYIVKIETLLLQWEKNEINEINEINAKEAPSALGTPYNL